MFIELIRDWTYNQMVVVPRVAWILLAVGWCYVDGNLEPLGIIQNLLNKDWENAGHLPGFLLSTMCSIIHVCMRLKSWIAGQSIKDLVLLPIIGLIRRSKRCIRPLFDMRWDSWRNQWDPRSDEIQREAINQEGGWKEWDVEFTIFIRYWIILIKLKIYVDSKEIINSYIFNLFLDI